VLCDDQTKMAGSSRITHRDSDHIEPKYHD
jgi:hypothetical protein